MSDAEAPNRPFVAGLYDDDLGGAYRGGAAYGAGADPGVTFAGIGGAEDPGGPDDDSSRWLYAVVARTP